MVVGWTCFPNSIRGTLQIFDNVEGPFVGTVIDSNKSRSWMSCQVTGIGFAMLLEKLKV